MLLLIPPVKNAQSARGEAKCGVSTVRVVVGGGGGDAHGKKPCLLPPVILTAVQEGVKMSGRNVPDNVLNGGMIAGGQQTSGEERRLPRSSTYFLIPRPAAAARGTHPSPRLSRSRS